ncbi:MAG: Glu/Leu/Phe/Val dehydrogenase [Deltaproteobacteria bacterium]|nr:Glu/Leu/Phe/Val dehydrogenase [Deltaproteobacteria bacterium]MBW2396666.1 Glu/Leu/Phe/Val dehydrogenase [Deltaproteobacteria bacterium]
MERLLDLPPQIVARELQRLGGGLAWWIRRGAHLEASHDSLLEISDFLEEGAGGARGHEAVFLAVGPETGALFGAFLHATSRGQAQGGLRRWPYPDLATFLRDGLRLSWGMSRKSALAGLWWGGGKGLIAGPDDPDEATRRLLYQEYGDFVSSLGGCYITAEDAGTRPDDIATVFERTRFVTCIPRGFGGAGNPAPFTAAGVVCGMEAALEAQGLECLVGRRIAMQGLGNVGTAMVDLLLARGVGSIVASEISATRCGELAARWRDAPVEVRLSRPEDTDLLIEPCDVLVPNALGGVIGPEIIPRLQTRMICGAANNPLLREDRDGAALAERCITYVPDFVVNRMGIVAVANEQYGRLENDPAIARHLDPAWEDGIPAVTRRLLELARDAGIPPVEAANRLAENRWNEPHPLFPGRTQAILHAFK